MIILDQVVVSSDVISEQFLCDLNKCKGACCVEGDLGAPLAEDELERIDDVLDVVKPYLSKEACDILDKEGAYLLDDEGDFSTTTIHGAECAFAFYEENGILKCGIEQAFKDGKTDFRKPISCHLYPIRINKLGDHEALNYDRWEICKPACELGKATKLPVYKFLKEALIRKYGTGWYDRLESEVELNH